MYIHVYVHPHEFDSSDIEIGRCNCHIIINKVIKSMDFQRDLQNCYWTWDNCSFHESALPRRMAFPVFALSANILPPSLSQLKKKISLANLLNAPRVLQQDPLVVQLSILCTDLDFSIYAFIFAACWAWTALPPILPAIYLFIYLLVSYLLCSSSPKSSTCPQSLLSLRSHSSLLEMHITVFITLCCDCWFYVCLLSWSGNCQKTAPMHFPPTGLCTVPGT